MKNTYLTILILLCLNFANAQTSDSLTTPATDKVQPSENAFKEQKKFGFAVFLKLYYTQPGAIGNNVLSKANEGAYGFGIEHNVIRYDNFYLAPGYEFTGYNVTDVALAGNIEHTNINNYYLRVAYKFDVVKKLTVSPFITGGSLMIHQKTNGKSYGKQRGAAFGLGADVDFYLEQGLSLFARARYNYLSPNVATNAEYESFFNNLQQLNFSLGLRVDIINK